MAYTMIDKDTRKIILKKHQSCGITECIFLKDLATMESDELHHCHVTPNALQQEKTEVN